MSRSLTALFLLLLAGVGFSPAAPEDGFRIVGEMNSPDFATRLKATSRLGDHIAERFRDAAVAVSENGAGVANWIAVKAAVLRRAELDGLSEMRNEVGKMGPDAELRFASLEAGWEDSLRKAAVSAGLDAPGDFEAEIIAAVKDAGTGGEVSHRAAPILTVS